MTRFKLFIENFFVYGLGGIIGKIIPFFMLPIITRLLPNSYYMGLNDMANTVLSFAQSFAVMGLYDAMFRMFFEKEDMSYKKEVCSSTLFFVLLTAAIVSCTMIMFRSSLSEIFLGQSNYDPLMIVTALGVLFGATNSIVAAPTRMENRRRIFLFTNLFSPIVSYLLATILLLRGKYVYALALGQLLSSLLTELIFICLNHSWFSIKKVHWTHIKSLLSIGLPLMPSFLIYWVFNSCDRLMISKMLGMEYTGIYAVGSKFGHISQLIYTAFAGGWQYFAFSTMRDSDQVELTSKIFEYLGTISIIATIIVSLGTDIFFTPLFGNSYAEAAVTVPYLFMAPLAQMLYQIAANQFIVIKKTWLFSGILAMGAISNVILNALLIPLIGIEGAAIATLMGFSLSTVVGVVILKRMKLFRIAGRFIIIVGIFCIYFLAHKILQTNFEMQILSIGTFFLILCFFYRKEFAILLIELKIKAKSICN